MVQTDGLNIYDVVNIIIIVYNTYVAVLHIGKYVALPKINKNSKAITERNRSTSKDKADVHERLFKKTDVNNVELEAKSFKSQSTIKRIHSKNYAFNKMKLSKELKNIWEKLNIEDNKITSIKTLCSACIKIQNYRDRIQRLWTDQNKFRI